MSLQNGDVPFLSYVMDNYLYSLSILIGGIIVTFLFAFIITFIYLISSSNIKRKFLNVLSIFEALPDLFLIFVFQFIVVYTYKFTGIKLLQLFGLNSNIYFLPILCLSLVPIFLLTRTLITILNEEHEKMYVEFAKAKGLSYMEIFTRHILRNILYSFSQYFSIVYWYTLSSLFIVEYLFAMKGFTSYIYSSLQSEIIVISMGLLMIPYLIILLINRIVKFIALGRGDAE